MYHALHGESFKINGTLYRVSSVTVREGETVVESVAVESPLPVGQRIYFPIKQAIDALQVQPKE